MISFYGSMLVLSFILNFVFCFYFFKDTKLSFYEKITILLFESWGFIIGGKIFTYLSNISAYEKFDFLTLGFSSLGAVIGGMLFLIIYSLIFRKSIKFIFNRTLITLPLMYSVGKVGCFVAGCCYGIKYDGFMSITYHHSLVAPNEVPLIPVQIIESIVFMLIFIYMFYRYKQKNINLCILIILCGMSKFILDFLRESHRGIILSVNQIVCLLFVIIALIFLLRDKKVRDCNEM